MRRSAFLAFLICLIGVVLLVDAPALAQDQAPNLTPPSEGQRNDAEMWRAVRQGVQGTVSIPDKKAGVLVQSEGEYWRSLRNGPVSTYGVWLMIGTIALLALFFAVRGRIRIENGRAGILILRFTGFERLVHWVTAGSFILLAITGLNVLYGRYFLIDWLGAETFSAITTVGKYVHNYIGLVFILGIFLMFVQWISHNIPNRHDLVWLAKGGGLFGKSVHPPARKFNAGQKIVFAAVVLGGGLLGATGLVLMFPFSFGFTIQDMQGAQLLHVIAALALSALIVAHIYIGSVGMEGGLEAMSNGYVDRNWAQEHHSLWVEELDTTAEPATSESTKTVPAE